MGEASEGGLGRRRFLRVAGATAVGSLSACAGPRPPSPTSATLPVTPVKPPATARAAAVPERLLPGDPGWRLTSYGLAGTIDGYCDRVSVLPGEPVRLHTSTTTDGFLVTAYRMGWYGGALARRVWRSGWVRGRAQAPAELDYATRTVSAAWPSTLTVPTDGWPEGAYLLRLDASGGAQRYVPLIVRSATTAGRTVLVHATATWQAYNAWGGYSLYHGPGRRYASRSLAVSFDRPYDPTGMAKFLVHERAVVALAERLGVELAYVTGAELDADERALDGAAAVFFLGHDEYWTPGARACVTRARDSGTNLAFLGANTCYRRVRLEGDGRVVVCYKTDAGRDPVYGTRPDLVTADFRADPMPDPESSLVGVYYDGYPADAPYVVTAPDHWVFAGTGVRQGDAFPHLVGVEYDRVNPSVPTPRPLEIIAHSPLMCGGRASYSDTAYYTAPGGAGVFASGTMRWAEALMAGTVDSPWTHGIDQRARRFVTTVTANLLRSFARGPAGEHEPAPRDNVTGLYG
jgi:hypothetical protein